MNDNEAFRHESTLGTAEHIFVWGAGAKTHERGGVNLKQNLTDTSSKMAKNASKYVRRNA